MKLRVFYCVVSIIAIIVSIVLCFTEMAELAFGIIGCAIFILLLATLIP